MRAVGEWIGRSDNAKVPSLVCLRIWRAADGRCQGCGRKIGAGERWDVDHRIALCNGGEHRESNLQVMGVDICGCHPKKTREDQKVYTRIKRVSTRWAGIRKPRTITQWRDFRGNIVKASRQR